MYCDLIMEQARRLRRISKCCCINLEIWAYTFGNEDICWDIYDGGNTKIIPGGNFQDLVAYIDKRELLFKKF